jgi:hypothetical protein
MTKFLMQTNVTLLTGPAPPYPSPALASPGQESHLTSLDIDSYGSPAAPVIDINEEVFYPPQADTYPNALHIIPACNSIESVIHDSSNNEADLGQLKNWHVIAIHSNNGFEGSEEFEYNFENVTESSIVHIQILLLILIK